MSNNDKPNFFIPGQTPAPSQNKGAPPQQPTPNNPSVPPPPKVGETYKPTQPPTQPATQPPTQPSQIPSSFPQQQQQQPHQQFQQQPQQIQQSQQQFQQQFQQQQTPRQNREANFPKPPIQFPDCYTLKTHRTNTDPKPPSTFYRIHSIDEGNCASEYMRSTVYRMPNTKESAAKSRIPIGVVLTPFADVPDGTQVPLVDTEGEGPLRCRRCRAYANPFVSFDRGTTGYSCPFCGFFNTFEGESAVAVDAFGRVDVSSRPELRYGSVDYVATKDYMLGREPQPLTYVFVLDASGEASRRGVFDAGLAAVRAAVRSAQHSEHASGVKVAVMTYSDRIQYYAVRRDRGTEVLVVSDTEDVFLPVHASHLAVDVQEDADLLEDFLEQLPSLALPGAAGDSALGAAMEGARQLGSGGGRVVVVAGREPSIGMGMVKVRPDYKLYGTENEGDLLHGVGSFWRNMGQRCVQSQVAVDVHLLPSAGFMETGQLGYPSRVSGGAVRVYAPFLPQRDTRHLAAAFQERIASPSAHDVVVRLRVSAGLELKGYHGNYQEMNPGDIDVSAVDGASSFAAELQYEDALPSDGQAYIQSAMLYTSAAGTRRIRVHTLRIPIATDITTVFQHADLPAVTVFTTAIAIHRMRKDDAPIHGVRRMVMERVAAILGAYRRHCARNPVPGQLVLPEALQLLPLYILGLTKTDALRPGTHTNIDRRIAALTEFSCPPPSRVFHMLYPRLFRLDTAAADVSEVPERSTENLLPPPHLLTRKELKDDGMYILDDTQDVQVIWVGQHCPGALLQGLFGVSSFVGLPDSTTACLRYDIDQIDTSNVEDERVRGALDVLRHLGAGRCVVRVVKQGAAGEREMLSRLIHDAVDHNDRGYADFLAAIHRTISSEQK